jgi:hypothetical protein
VSWTDIYPFLSDEMVDGYHREVTPAELAQLNECFCVDQIFNPLNTSHLVVVSLYRDLRSQKEKLKCDFEEECFEDDLESWFGLQQVLRGADALRLKYPQTALRVYLSADLHYAVECLTKAGCEVFLMKTSGSVNLCL